MATFTTQQCLGRGPIGGVGGGSAPIDRYAEYTLTAAATGDYIDMLWAPKGGILIGMSFTSDDVDSNGAPTIAWSIGDAASPTRLVSSATVGQAGGFTNTLAAGIGAMHYKYPADTKVRVTATTGSATFQAGTIKLRMTFMIDPVLA